MDSSVGFAGGPENIPKMGFSQNGCTFLLVVLAAVFIQGHQGKRRFQFVALRHCAVNSPLPMHNDRLFNRSALAYSSRPDWAMQVH